MKIQHCIRQMKEKQKGLIKTIKAKGELRTRIRDMGLLPGTEVAVVCITR